MEDNLEVCDNDDEEDVKNNDADVDDDDDELMDKAGADNIELDNEIRVVTKVIYDHSQESQGSSLNALSGSAWTTRVSLHWCWTKFLLTNIWNFGIKNRQMLVQ